MRRAIILVLAVAAWALSASAATYRGAMDNRYGQAPLAGFTAQSNAWSAAGGAGKGLRLEWIVDDTSNPGYWTYRYKLVRGRGVNKAFALFDIETASDFTASEIHGWTPVSVMTSSDVEIDLTANPVTFVDPVLFSATHDFSNAAVTEVSAATALNAHELCQYSGDPSIVPVGTVTANGTSTGPIAHPFYGIRWIFPGTGLNAYLATSWELVLVTTRAPMWGSFFGWGDQTSQSPQWYANFYSNNIGSASRLSRAPASTVDGSGNALSQFSDYLGWILVPGPAASAPTVVTTSPASGATGVALNGAIAVTFSAPMNASSVQTAFTFQTGGANVLGTVAYDAASRTAIFTPTSALSASTPYAATVAVTAQDEGGRALTAPATWSFTTGTASDTAAPTVLQTVPASSASGVAVGSAVVALFSEPLDPRTVGGSTFTLAGASGPVSGTVGYDPATSTATFTPAGALSYSASYTASITSGVRDLAGNAAAGTSWTFTTAAPSDTTPPGVASFVPADGATDVRADALIAVSFDEEVDPTTVTAAHFTVDGVSGSVTYDASARTATLHHDLLSPHASHAVTVSGIRDLFGNAMAEWTWGFTTAPSGNVDPDDATGVVDAEDVRLAMDIALGNAEAKERQLLAGDVAPLVNGHPQPDGILDVGDVVVLLRKVTGDTKSW